MSYEEIIADEQTYTLGDGDVLENLLIDASNGADVTIIANGTNWTIRNIAISGYYEADGPIIECRDTAPDGESLIENVYMGDGASKTGSPNRNGPRAIDVTGHHGQLTLRYCNVQGWPNHGIDTVGGPGTVRLEHCLAANNGLADFRCAEGDSLESCVAFNDHTVYGWFHQHHDFVEATGRPLWAESGSGSEIAAHDCHFDAGAYPLAIEGEHGANITHYSGAINGETRQTSPGAVDVTEAVGSEPSHKAPTGVPTAPQQAASGTVGHGGATQDPRPPDVPDPTFHQYGVAYYSETGRAQVTNSDFIWEGDGRPLWAESDAQGYAHGRFDLNPEVDDDYATDGGDDPGDVEVDSEDSAPNDDSDAPDGGEDVADGSEDTSTAIELRIADCYVSDIEEGPAVHIGAESDDATCVVENVHIDGAPVGVLADGVSVDVRDCEINADEQFATENGGEITEENVGSNPSAPDSVPASVDEAAQGNAFQDL